MQVKTAERRAFKTGGCAMSFKSDEQYLLHLCDLRTVGSLKAALLYYRQRHLLVLRYAALFIYTATPCVH